jgi:3-phosphoshikimate 1-carboxyvinyltransferase
VESIEIIGANSLAGEVRVDGDKSISHRAVMFGALAEGTTRIGNLLKGEDVLATMAAFRAMGVDIREQDGEVLIEGVGMAGLSPPPGPLDMGNSGTALRLLSGILCGQRWETTLTGDASLSSRPMGRIITPLSLMGAEFSSREGRPPLTIRPPERLVPIRYELPMASAQVKSAVLLAGLYTDGETAVKEPAPTRDHTERMLRGFDYPVAVDGDWITLRGGGRLVGREVVVPADLSSATFFILGGLISPGSGLVLPAVGVNPTRDGVLRILRRMGADIRVVNPREVSGEPVADLHVSHSRLHGVDLDAGDIALAVDEVPALAVAAACAEGVTRIQGAEELRVKESDRISTTVAGLRALGISVSEQPDGMTITGGRLAGGEVDSHGDHRIAMAFAMAGNAATGTVRIRNTSCIGTSFPGFAESAKGAGMALREA